MAKKKSDQTEASAEQQALEHRVDAMMSVEAPAAKPAAASGPPASPDSKPDPGDPPAAEPSPTAPLLPTKLLKAIGADKKVKAKTSEERPADIAVRIGDPADKPKSKAKPALEAAAPPPELSQPTPESDPAEPPAAPADSILEDSATDKAVDDIVAHEADTQLAVDDAVARQRTAEAEGRNQPGLLVAFFTSPWTWLIIIGTLSVLYLWYR